MSLIFLHTYNTTNLTNNQIKKQFYEKMKIDFHSSLSLFTFSLSHLLRVPQDFFHDMRYNYLINLLR